MIGGPGRSERLEFRRHAQLGKGGLQMAEYPAGLSLRLGSSKVGQLYDYRKMLYD
jgi:hypothetical protein